MNTGSRLKSWLQNQKDSSVSFLAEKLLRKKLERFGELLEFQLNSRARSASLKVLLKGESAPVELVVESYEVTVGQGESWVTVRRARASRAWLTELLTEFLIGRRIPIPEEYGSLARMLL